jgi:hypothetical protein
MNRFAHFDVAELQMIGPGTRAECDCEQVIGKSFLISGYRQDGERVDCPSCGRDWVHVCDEAEGCTWVRASKTELNPAPNKGENDD